jgi:hypothetical protein
LKKSPLNPGTSPLRRTPMQRRTVGIKPRSKKRAELYEKRRPFVARILGERPVCEVCRAKPSQDCHEPLRRSAGGSILDEANCMAVCRLCHSKIHDNVAWAMSKGYLRSRYDTA